MTNKSKTKSIPYLFLIILLIFLTFIVGLRYGKHVEQTNEEIAFILSITPVDVSPTMTVSPTDTPPLSFNTLNSNTCGVTFLYPDTVAPHIATHEAVLKNMNGRVLSINCQNKETNESSPSAVLGTSDEDDSENTITFQDETLPYKITSNDSSDMRQYQFNYTHPITGEELTFIVEENLLPLLDETISFEERQQ